MRWKTLKEGLWIFVTLGLLGCVASRKKPWAGGIFAGLIAFTLYFFRDPDRPIDPDPLVVVSPADGVITEISEVPADHPDGESKIRIGIFLSVFDVHVNRSPIAGVVTLSNEIKGAYLDARNPESSKRNARRTWVIQGAHATVVVRQITGAIARRIVPWAKLGDFLRKGERFGMIRFGSRTEIDLPANVQLECAVGDRVKGSESVIARLVKS